ncbi:SEN1 N terminal-domain-containing protein [Boletus edulis BED1]|uniref:SEN1 N terminal-domain-containing protein n=1 Tax=Boletus edulis BED1 TaxID=1328754 RepID=A0AAD4GHN6_BOLED|nr:SEN1 N terminal-domain-containing protein [Boletus edulis BED1]
MTTTSDVDKVKALLVRLRDTPINSADGSDDVLAPVFTHLMKVPPNSSDKCYHWFCSRADQVTVGAATFLLRLFAYSSPKVEEWKARLIACLTGCCPCVKAFGEVKLTSRSTYFGAFSDDILQGFHRSFNDWELEFVKGGLASAGVSVAARNDSSALRAVPPGIIYHSVSNIRVLRDPDILGVIRSRPMVSSWPTDVPPPGLIILMFDESQAVRQWAKAFIAACSEIPMAEDHFVTGHEVALQTILNLIAKTANQHDPAGLHAPLLEGETFPVGSFSFTSDSNEIWAGFCQVLRHIPPKTILRSYGGTDCRRVVTSHLHDTGPQFANILKCMLFLLKRLNADLWNGEAPEFPQVVFDAIKDNPAYIKLVEEVQVVHLDEKPWFLSWFGEYLLSLKDSGVFGDVLAKTVDLLCEELQHERFKEVLPVVMFAATRLLSSLVRKSQTEELVRYRQTISSVLDIHVDVFTSVAFGRHYTDQKWKSARTGLARDVREIAGAINQSCVFLAGQTDTFSTCTVREHMWKKTYESLQTNDADGAICLLDLVAQYAHLDVLNSRAYKPILSKPNARVAFDAINRSLQVTRQGFVEAISKFANYNQPTFVRNVLGRPEVAGNVMILMFSPIDDIQTAAKTLVGQAFDVDVRLDCFRALLSNLPNPSLSAIIGFLEKFIRHAPQVTEACSLSKSLVQCLTDIIEVLCSSPDGLLHSDAFLQPQDLQGPASQLPQLWMLMTQSITVIFKRTPLWADFFDIPDMTVWMRDALIFGRDMLAQWRVIESAAVKATEEDFTLTQKQSKLSRVGKRMMNDLQPVLPELARWLRLSDEELLHQSFALIQTVLECFRTTGVPPSEAGLAKLNKHVDDARKTTHGTPRTRLDSARIAKLEDTLAAFESDDDDVEIISVTTASSRTSASAPKDAKPVRKEVQTILKPPAPQKPAKASLVDQPKLERPAFPTFKRTREIVTSGPSRPLPGHNEVPKVPLAVDSSSSESESDADTGGAKGLAALAKLQKPSHAQKPTERRQVKMLDVTNRAKNATMERLHRRDDARRRAMRLKPDISGLHRAILSWDYDHHGPDPPTQGTLLRVPDKFVDHHQYLSVFEPLLLLECWAQIVQSKEGTQPSYDCKICSKQFTDDFIDLEVTISEALQKDWRLLETDIVLLRHPSGKTSVLAKTQSYFTNMNGTQVTLRCFIPNGADLGLQINSVWSLKKVFSLATLHREYGALVALPFYDAFQSIMQPRISAMPHLDNHDIDQAMSTYRVNEPQARAILGSLRAEGFKLIQGPPGTGKTSTICGLVEAFLSRRPRATTSIHAGRNSTQADKGPVQKILLCAPSNAAIDEVASRLKEGYRGTQKRGEPIKVVRIGSEKAIDIGARDVALDYLVEQKMNGENMRDSNDAGKQQIALLRQEIESVKRAKQQKLEELSTVQNNTARTLAIEEEIKKLNSRRMALTQQFDRLKDKQKSDHRTLDAVRRRFRIEVLQEADVICTTLAGSGHDSVEQLEFEMVIIDEAAQAVELTSLIPLKFRTPKCIMVGDPQQLPPTVLSQEACKFNYNQSLFVRLQKHRPEAVHLLSIQYRMHPEISQLPSRLFYQGRLLDGPDMGVKTRQPWQSHAKFGYYRFFNVLGGREESAIGHSMKNVLEAQVAVALYARLRKEFASVDFDFRIGIVSMYRGQVVEMQRTFERRFGEDIRGKIHFNTVDGFQGQEKDIIILSCVRAGPGVQSVGFLADVRRMNVALTRAKSSLFILGNTATLERSDADWKEIVNNARTRSLLTDADVSYFTEPTHVQSARPASPTKASKQRPVLKPPEPVDLVTPQSMAESVRAKPQSQNAPSSPIVPTSVQTVPASSSMKHLLPKRPFVEDASSSIREDRPKPPAHKRHKKDRGSIFIPKKPKP